MQEKQTELAHILGSICIWEPYSRRISPSTVVLDLNSERLQQRNVRSLICHIFCLGIAELV